MISYLVVILFVLAVPLFAYAELPNTILISQDATVPGCETISSCFEPYEMKISTGDLVQWKNPTDSAHTVTSGTPSGLDGYFDSFMNGGDSFSHVFSSPGKYLYYCMIHPWMTGMVLVSDGDTLEKQQNTLSPCTDARSFFLQGMRSESLFEDFEKYCKYTKSSDANFSYDIDQPKKPEKATYGIANDYTNDKGLNAALTTQRGNHGDTKHDGHKSNGSLNIASFLPNLYIFSADVYSENLHGTNSTSKITITFFTKDDKKELVIVPHHTLLVSELFTNSKSSAVMYLDYTPSQRNWQHVQYDLQYFYNDNFGSYSDVTYWTLSIGGESYTSQLNASHGWSVTIDNMLVADNNYHLPSLAYQKMMGVAPENILCNNGKSLAFKIADRTPICVNNSSIDKLYEIKFAIPLDTTSETKKQLDADKTFFKKLLVDHISHKPFIVTSSIDKIHEISKYNNYKMNVIEKLLPPPPTNVDFDTFTLEESASVILPAVPASGVFTGQEQSVWNSGEPANAPSVGKVQSAGSNIPFQEFSTTNVQILGVDEPDFVKNNADQIHVITSDEIVTTDDSLEKYHTIITSEIGDVKPHNLFLYKNNLVVLYDSDAGTEITIFDVSSESFVLLNHVIIDDAFYQARMIDDVVYVITKSSLSDTSPFITDKQTSQTLAIPQIHYFADHFDENPVLNTVTSIKLSNMDVQSSTFVLGDTDTTYVSKDSIYFSYQHNYNSMILSSLDDEFLINNLIDAMSPYEMISLYQLNDTSINPSQSFTTGNALYQLNDEINDTGDVSIKQQILLEVLNTFDSGDKVLFQSITEQLDLPFTDKIQSIIHKIGISDGAIKYQTFGNVQGDISNQFALDQDDENLRVVTSSWGNNGLQSNVYVLDDTMSVVGSLEGIAPGETLHSTRFADDWLYLVTFRQVDPFFVIDVSTVQPKVLGELKIPGYSTYLQNYDDAHVVGIGYDTNRNRWDDTTDAGIKISMFDVTDFANPTETDNVIIGNKGTSSAGTIEHKAVFIDSAKKLIALPIVFDEKLIFYVYTVNDDYTLTEHSQIPHEIDIDNPNHVRTFYIDDTLYTVTPKLIKANSITQQDYTVNKLFLE